MVLGSLPGVGTEKTDDIGAVQRHAPSVVVFRCAPDLEAVRFVHGDARDCNRCAQMINSTHDPSMTSWVAAANRPAADFPIQNLPFGIFASNGGAAAGTIGIAIGDGVLDLRKCAENRLITCASSTLDACRAPTLNRLMALDPEELGSLRRAIQDVLREDCPAPIRRRAAELVMPLAAVRLFVPAVIGDYTDFFASIHHATNTGRLFRAEKPIPDNYRTMPIAYHGRSSSIVVSGTNVPRPHGQKPDGGRDVVFGLSGRLDFELELGAFVGRGNELGVSIPLADASARLFGVCLLNDWSARDIQFWESRPLGPFLGKSFATTISPWVVTMEALAPFRAPAVVRAAGDPPILDYLNNESDQAAGAIDIELEAAILTPRMRAQGIEPARMTRIGFRSMYWTLGQMVAHHTSNGCNLRTGDLIGSGTVSGEEPGSFGCLLEATRDGREPITLPGGETRAFLEDGDEVVFTGSSVRSGFARIGFGECRGRIVAGSQPRNHESTK